MVASSAFMIAEAERRFPVRVRIGVPPDELGYRLDGIRHGSTRIAVHRAGL
jgi:hypothetical protein